MREGRRGGGGGGEEGKKLEGRRGRGGNVVCYEAVTETGKYHHTLPTVYMHCGCVYNAYLRTRVVYKTKTTTERTENLRQFS